MKQIKIFILLFIFSATTYASDKYYSASLFLNDGSIKRGLATYVNTGNGEYILFKSDEKSDSEKIKSINIKKLVYNSGEESYEYEYLKVYKGWKQINIEGPIWLEVVDKGFATLYLAITYIESGVLPQNRTSVAFRDYYIMRKGEPAAKLYATISTANNNQTFRAKAPLYFADYPELAEKIKNKEYTWKDLEEVVKIYNNWAKEHQ